MMRFLRHTPLDSLQTLEEDINSLRPRVTGIEKALSDAESWKCPRYLIAKWEELKGWLLEDEYGPCELLQRWETAYEEATDEDTDPKVAQDELRYDLDFGMQRMEDSRQGIIEKINDIAIAKAVKSIGVALQRPLRVCPCCQPKTFRH